jgi:hypothetical protein
MRTRPSLSRRCAVAAAIHISPIRFSSALKCAIELRREFYRGLGELEEYLAAWAAFRDWEVAHAAGAC